MRTRPSSRLLVLDPQNRLLLFKFEHRKGPLAGQSFWATPGGEKLTKRIPQRRVGSESDLDGAIMLLASSASRYMTGSVVTVDGGFLLT